MVGHETLLPRLVGHSNAQVDHSSSAHEASHKDRLSPRTLLLLLGLLLGFFYHCFSRRPLSVVVFVFVFVPCVRFAVLPVGWVGA